MNAGDYVEKANLAAEAAAAKAQRDDQLVLLAWAQFNMLRAIEQRLLVIEDQGTKPVGVGRRIEHGTEVYP